MSDISRVRILHRSLNDTGSSIGSSYKYQCEKTLLALYSVDREDRTVPAYLLTSKDGASVWHWLLDDRTEPEFKKAMKSNYGYIYREFDEEAQRLLNDALKVGAK